ncbi:MAG: FHA domain-containing protein, partial [Verrucomicrobia bacterium]|nr:FHA domain-containing protein [Verrucomicrobiota bacterium]
MYGLHILSGPWKGKRVTVREPNLLIGRDPECHLRLPDDEVSRKHVLIEERPDGVTVRDQGSLNGFLVNNQPSRECRLNDGAILELGRTRLQFRVALPPGGPSRRRIGWLQGLTAVAVAALLLGQGFFLFALSLRGMQLLKTLEKAIAPAATVRAAAKTEEGDKLLAEAQTYLKETTPAPSEPSESASASEPGEMSHEISKLRADVEDLRRQVAEAAAPVPTPPPPEPSALPPPEPEPVAEPTPPAPAEVVEDPLVQRARAMLDEATLEIHRVNLLEADQILERIQIMAPDFLPATIERARLYEQRGLLSKAGEQWADVLQRSIGTPLYEQAAAER